MPSAASQPRRIFIDGERAASDVGLACELALMVRHVSHGDMRKPNPGEDFVQVRYGRVF